MRTADQPGALPPVLAEPAVSSGGYRLRWAAEWMRERFWVIPAVLLVLGTGLAVLTAEGGALLHSLGGLPADASWGSGFLESIAGATLTFLGVVFTLTLVSLQLASSQLSPRVIRTFVRSGITRVAFGTLLAAFAYSVTALVLSHGRNGPATSRAVDVAAVLVAVSLVVFLRYVASMMELLQVVDVISAVARETRAAVNFGRGRTLYQDPAFGLRQLADIAAQALSAAVNQPTTAVLVIDSLEDVLLQIARRLLAAYATLEAAAAPARRGGVAARREELARQLASDGTAQQALRADPMGLG